MTAIKKTWLSIILSLLFSTNIIGQNSPILNLPSNGATNIPITNTFYWSEVTGASSYVLQISSTSGFYWNQIDLSNLTTTHQQVNGLYMGSLYYWRVGAVVSGITYWSTTGSFTTGSPGGEGGNPGPNHIAPSSGSTVPQTNQSLTWDPVSGATYHVQISTTSNFSYNQVEQSGLTIAEIIPTGLYLNITYYWRVNATVNGETTDWTVPWSFTTSSTPPSIPAAPILATPSNNSSGTGTTPTLTWNASSGADSYGLEVSSDEQFANIITNQTGITTTSYALSGLSNQTTYYWRVNATNNSGSSSWSNVFNFNTSTSTSTATTLVSPNNGATGVPIVNTFYWNEVQGATYTLQISGTSNFSINNIDVSGITDTNYQVTNLGYATFYYWRVGANDGNGVVWSNSRSLTTGSSGGIGGNPGPSLLVPSNASSNIPTNQTFAWEEVAGATYQIQISASSYFGANQVDQSGVTVPSYPASGLYLGTSYFWRVNATTVEGTTDWSEVYSFTTSSTSPTSPVSPILASPVNSATDVSTSTQLVWYQSSEADSYTIEVATDASFNNTIINQAGITTTSYNTSGLSQGQIYYWRVEAVSTSGNSGWSNVWSFTTTSTSITPVLTVTTPEDNALTNVSPVTVTGSVDDPANSVKINGVNVTVNGDGSFSGTVTLTEGENTVLITAYNEINDSVSVFRLINYDSTLPVITIISPDNNLITSSSSLNITGSVNDASDVTLTVNGDTTTVDGSGNFTYNASLLEGTNSIIVIATDEAGNSNTETRTLLVDTVEPIIVITNPVDSSVVGSLSTTLTGNVNDTAISLLTINGDTVAVDGVGNFTFNVSLLEGENNINIIATDKAGNQTNKMHLIVADTTPALLVVNTPTDSLTTNQTTIAVTGNVTDATDMIVTVNGDTVIVDGTGNYSTNVVLSEGQNVIMIIVSDEGGNTKTVTRNVLLDIIAPSITITSPADSSITSLTTATLIGNVTGTDINVVTVNGDTVIVDINGDFSAFINLVEGKNNISIVATDTVGNETNLAHVIYLDSTPPVLTITNPADSTVTNQATIILTGTVDGSNDVVIVNGDTVAVDQNGDFSKELTLAEAENIINITATDEVGNETSITRLITLSYMPPVLTIDEPQNNFRTTENFVTVTGEVSESAAIVTINGDTVAVTSEGLFTALTEINYEVNIIEIIAVNAAGSDKITKTVIKEEIIIIPDNPIDIAPPIDSTVVTTLGKSVEFLYTGSNPIQTDLVVDTLSELRIAVLRGNVVDNNGSYLSGVKVSIKNHNEFGKTYSRDDGWFDMVVNGGGEFVVNFSKNGYLTAQRLIETYWRDYSILDPIILVALDTNVTHVDFTDSVQVAHGSVETDTDGSRQATMLFKEGTSVILELPDGSTQSLSSVNVRATEYTVGEGGPSKMPADLPPASQYTYCVELTADEAINVGATKVSFDKPISYFVENFLNFPIGTVVPVGYYDREKSEWVAADNGRVVKIVDIVNGFAEIDITGDDIAESSIILQPFGILDLERKELAEKYSVGQSLWFINISHFTPYDFNWGLSRYATSINVSPPNNKQIDNGCTIQGSIIGIHNQTLGESIGIVGTPYSLNYTTEAVDGYKKNRYLKIPVIGESVPVALGSVSVTVRIAGTEHIEKFDSLYPNLTYNFIWDGKDGYGRDVKGSFPVLTSKSYKFTGSTNDNNSEYGVLIDTSTAPLSSSPKAFSRRGWWWSDWTMNSEPRIATRDNTVNQFTNSFLTAPLDRSIKALPNWGINVHHSYDVNKGTLYFGDGSKRSVRGELLIKTVAGNGNHGDLIYCYGGMGGNAQDAFFSMPEGVKVDSDGNVYFSVYSCNKIFKVNKEGIISPFIHQNRVEDFDIGVDGSFYIIGNNTIRRVRPDGTSETIATPPTGGGSGIAVSPEGDIYYFNYVTRKMYRIANDGTSTIIAGNGSYTSSGDGVSALEAGINVRGIDVGKDGEIYFADDMGQAIRKIDKDGYIRTIAGTLNNYGYEGNGELAVNALLFYPSGVTIDDDGNIIITEGANVSSLCIIRKVDTEGIISTIAGKAYVNDFSGEETFALDAKLDDPRGIAVGPDGVIYFADYYNYRIRKLYPSMPQFSANDISIASENGSEVYNFSSYGKHLNTMDAITSKIKYNFSYNSDGLLTSITDIDSLVTHIERNASGNPTAIIAPFGQRTEITLDGNGYVGEIKNPNNEIVSLEYMSDGLLTKMTNPRLFDYIFTYDSLGLLIKDENPANGFTELERTETNNGYQVLTRTAEGREKTYGVEWMSEGGIRFNNTGEDSLSIIVEQKPNGTSTKYSPDGTITITKLEPDPRFGLEVPLKNYETTLPSGLKMKFEHKRIITQMIANEVTGIADTAIVNGKKWISDYNGNLNMFTSTSPEGRQSFSYTDSLGRVFQSSALGIAPVNYLYNSNGFLTSVSQDGKTSTFNYNTNGRLQSTTDPMNRTESYEYDAVGRVVKQTLYNNKEILYSYDANGNLTSLTPPGRPAHIFDYTAVDLTNNYVPPIVPDSAGVTKYIYNLDKQLVSTILPDSTSINITYDTTDCGCSSNGKPTEINFSRGTLFINYDTLGRLESTITPESNLLTYSYDGSLPLSIAWSGAVNGTVGVIYNNDFNVVSQSINASNTVNFSYDNDGLLTSAGLMNYNYNMQNGLLLSSSLGNYTSSYAYDNTGNIDTFTTKYNTTDLFKTVYEKDSLSRITKITETIEGVSTETEYRYNQIGYLVEVKQNGIVSTQYSYDNNGNRLMTIKNPMTTNDTLLAVYDNQDRMLTNGTESYIYGKRGNLQAKVSGTDTTKYYYDNLGNLNSVILADGTIIDYVIDGQNRRIAKLLNGQITKKWLYQDQLNPVAELDSANNIVARYVYGTKANVPEYIVKADTTYKIISDHLGSVRMLVNTSNGNIAQQMDYDAWGNQVSNLGSNISSLSFAGGLYDEHTGLVRFGARDYDATVGRWTSKDPILFAGGQSNLYEYCLNDPINILDPNGLQVIGIYSKSSGKIHALDLNTFDVVNINAESGGKPFGDPIPNGLYEILDQAQNPESFRLDAADRYPRNDVHESSGRNRFRLHEPGNTIGCIAATNTTGWQSLKNLLNNTKTTQVPDNAKPWWKFWGGQEYIKRYGFFYVRD
ncbi:MAG: hypothetical protein KKF62_14085 [Bacteroidetes bacterium]|nr:hypothetical protein [Bacteroidota bacterium]MBU1114203.1 hypothetical protein [Bacteroidota bacterium]MBU1797012.1 hypothetical protein [Bacteroidota bacterium]